MRTWRNNSQDEDVPPNPAPIERLDHRRFVPSKIHYITFSPRERIPLGELREISDVGLMPRINVRQLLGERGARENYLIAI